MTDMVSMILGQLVRVGKVSSVNTTELKARVLFEDRENMVSDWLQVLQHPNATVEVDSAGSHSHGASASEGSVTISPGGSHTHGARLKTWMPEVGDHVVCLYLPMWNAAGFILGRIM